MPEIRQTTENTRAIIQGQGVTPYASPLVYRLARERKVDLHQVTGTARQGRISQADIMQFVQSTPDTWQTRPEVTDAHVDISHFGAIVRHPLTQRQKTSASSLNHNWTTIPHVTCHDEADITDLEALRTVWNQEHSASEINITQQAFLIKASATALTAFPRLNASFDRESDELLLKKYLHMGFTVETPEGDVIPVIRDVASKSVTQLAQEIVILSRKAQDGTLSAAEMHGGCFTLCSLEGVGGLTFTPIINGQEVAILGISDTRWQSSSASTEQKRMILPLSLSYDNRVVDNSTAARFMVYLKSLLTDIRLLLL